jgi:hypothetical protein
MFRVDFCMSNNVECNFCRRGLTFFCLVKVDPSILLSPYQKIMPVIKHQQQTRYLKGYDYNLKERRYRYYKEIRILAYRSIIITGDAYAISLLSNFYSSINMI